MEVVMVTILCKVFNHEKYLRKTLDGFVMQKTDFKFEAIVHDDASTDGSANIIREYEAKYPDIIKAVYQTENQYSKGVNIYNSFMRPLVKGKYFANCDGDDCWIDEFKLAKQVHYMEEHPECTFCFTNAIMDNVQSRKKRIMIPYRKGEELFITENNVYDVGQIARFAFLPYCSFLYPVSNLGKMPDTYYIPTWGGDRKVSYYATALGYAYFINEPTCCYHYGVKGSMMTKEKTKKQIADIERSFVTLNNNIDRFTNYKYSDCFQKENLKYLRDILMLTGNTALLSEKELNAVYECDTLFTKIVRFFVCRMPNGLFNFLRAMKRKIGILS